MQQDSDREQPNYGKSEFHVDGPSINLHDFMYMTIVQSNPAGNPSVYAYLRIGEGIQWEAVHSLLSDDTGFIKVLFSLCDESISIP